MKQSHSVSKNSRLPFSILVAFILLCFVGNIFAGAQITIKNNDEDFEGFNDTTAWTPTGGNPATTLGQARLNCFQRAADIWGGLLNSDVEIVVVSQMDEQDCGPFSGVLGSAGAVILTANFSGAPRSDTFYPSALANALAGDDLTPILGEIVATFNSRLNGDPGCLLGAEWYYGFDENPGPNQIDFITVLLHEFGHGLGFATYVNIFTGEKSDGLDDAFMVHMDQHGASPSRYSEMTNEERRDANVSDPDMRWTGPAVTNAWPLIPLVKGTVDGSIRLHAPDPINPGSSLSHFSDAVFPNEPMEWAYTVPTHDPGLALELMNDIGWSLDPTSVAAQDVSLPEGFTLYQNYPNPFNPNTTIQFNLPLAGTVSLQIYNTSGQVVRTLVNGTHPQGRYSINWDGRNDLGQQVSSGIYFYRLSSNKGISQTRKMMVIK